MARFVGVLFAVALVLVVAGAVTVARRVVRDVRSVADALASITPRITTGRATDAALFTSDAGASSSPPRVARPTSRARPEPTVVASAVPAEPLLDAMIARVCPTAVRLLTQSYARCGCMRPAPHLGTALDEACERWMRDEVGDGTWEILEPDEEEIARCLNGIEAARDACWMDEATRQCGRLLREPVSLGEACMDSSLLCRSGVCAETCVPRPREGQPSADGFCPTGLVLDESDACIRPRREGAPCTSELCEPGLFCDGSTCTRPHRAGEACRQTADCSDGLLCGGDGRCAAAPVWCEDGDECGWAYVCDESWSSRCVPCLGCVGERTCGDGTTTCGDDWTCEDEGNGGRCSPELCRPDELVDVLDP